MRASRLVVLMSAVIYGVCATECDNRNLIKLYADESTQTVSYVGGSVRRGSSQCLHWKISSQPFDTLEMKILGVTFFGDGCLIVLDGSNTSSTPNSFTLRQECSNITTQQVPMYLTNLYSYIKFYPGSDVIEGSFRLMYKTRSKVSYGTQFTSKGASPVVLSVLAVLIVIVIIVGCVALFCKQIRSRKKERKDTYTVDPVQRVDINVL